MTAGAPPDVVALPLEEALAQLQAAGWRARLRSTAPPRGLPAGGLQRVVRQRATGPDEVELVVAWERYTVAGRSGPPPAEQSRG